MKKLIPLLSIIPILALIGSAPATFNKAAEFYTQDFKKGTGIEIVEISSEIGIKGDEIFIGRPRVWVNDCIALCECGAPATSISFKKGKLLAQCYEHAPRFKPANQIKYPDTPVIPTKPETDTKKK